MRIFLCSSAILAMMLVITSCSNSSSDQTIDSAEWVDIFDGETLDGWKRLNGNAEYTVEDGVIVGRTKRNTPNTFLATEQTFSDFILEYEFLVDPYINSGVQIRSNSNDYQNGNVHGYQVEIDPSERGWTAGIYDQSRRGWLYPGGLNENAAKAFKQNEWNKVYVEAIGSSIRTWLNDQPVAYLVDDMTASGFIALQIHSVDRAELVGREIQWRNIRIKTADLTPKQADFPYIVNKIPNTISEGERQQGWISLFDGSSISEWRGAHQENFPPEGWKINQGELQVTESGGGESQHGGDIVTRDEFSSFEFQTEFKLSKGANSGIKYFVTEEYGNTSGSAIGLEFQLLDNDNHPDAKNGIAGNRTLGSLYDLITAEVPERYVNAPGEWNHARIVVHPNNKVQHWLNGIKVVEYTRGSANYKALVRGSKYKDWKNFGQAAQGHILLQDHGNAVSFRSVKVKRLD